VSKDSAEEIRGRKQRDLFPVDIRLTNWISEALILLAIRHSSHVT